MEALADKNGSTKKHFRSASEGVARQKNAAIVTGASSGIGLAISGELAKRGYPLLMISNEEEPLKKAAMELEEKFSIKAYALCMDLAQSQSAEMVFDYCRENQIASEILVNNAGFFYFKDVTDTPQERIDAMINLHINTPVKLSKLFAERMLAENRRGYLLNMASISSRMLMPGISMYGATKSFLRFFSRSMRNEVFDRGVSITTVSPGAVATNLYRLPPRYQKLGISLGVIITPQRLASTAVRKMLKRRAEYIPGRCINGFLVFLVNIMPEKLIRWIKVKI